jgi:hypothetical protein
MHGGGAIGRAQGGGQPRDCGDAQAVDGFDSSCPSGGDLVGERTQFGGDGRGALGLDDLVELAPRVA